MSNLGQIIAYLSTDTGQVRDHNEDFIDFWEPKTVEEERKNGWLYLVADGVGGADAGEVASEYASQRTVFHYLNKTEYQDWGQRLHDAMQSANTDLRQFVADRNDNSRMATTMVAAVIQEDRLFVSNVGDSRGYQYRNGRFRQVTKDQSLVAKLVEEGAITAAEAEHHPRKNVILYSLGSENNPKIDLFDLTWEAGDILVLCSDGLTKHVTDDEISNIITTQEPKKAASTLIALANERGGEDNISAAVIKNKPKETAVSTQQEGSETAVPTNLTISTDHRLLMMLFTIGLSIAQSVLIFLVWFFLRV
ncbi:MAG: Stp1/IreP family PP2C-type Ser/Thr phosphatase [Chloroflexi bacterium]|nr:Stp1/IreP family PP2C-type Ser/Thr phosphatase [Chloroflexota bacterium]